MRKSITRALLAFCLLSALGFAELHVLALGEVHRDNLQRLLAHQAALAPEEADRPLHWLDDCFAPQPPSYALTQNNLWLVNKDHGHLVPRWKSQSGIELPNLGVTTSALPDQPLLSASLLSPRAVRQSRSLATSRYWYRNGIDAWRQAG